MINIPIDWKVFEYKFSANPRQAFESLSYMLFCYELKQEYGIFRYFNQPYIETQPVITEDGYVTGFQAKYYDASTTLSSKETELKDAIKGAKIKYAGINRIIFYLNKELSASTIEDVDKPIYQRNIEKCGRDNGIEIEWRVQSNFEKILLSSELAVLRDLYFNPNPGIRQFAEDIQIRSKAILKNIKSVINYQGQEIKLLYGQEKFVDFMDSDNQVFVVCGAAGTGKSGLVKDFISNICEVNQEITSIILAASDMDVEEKTLFLKRYSGYCLEDLFALYQNEECKICVIDAAEKYTTFKYPDVFENIMKDFINDGWKVIITIRAIYKEGFCNLFFENVKYDECIIEGIDNNVLEDLSAKYGFLLPEDTKLCNLLCNLFYLKLYLNLKNLSTTTLMNTEVFSECIWRQVIRNESKKYNNLPAKREQFIVDMVFDMLQKDSYAYQISTSADYEAMCSLEDSGIIAPYNDSEGLWMMSHDVYEELVIKHILSNRYENNEPVDKIFEGFGFSLRSRKMFRIWLETQLEHCDSNCLDFLMELLGEKELEQSWRDETLIALMNSENDEAFHILKSMLSQDEYKLFTRTVFLLNTACRNVNLKFLKMVEKSGVNRYRFTKPEGKAWNTIFRYINDNRLLIPWSVKNLTIVTDALNAWTNNYESGETTRQAGIIAIFLKKKLWEESKYKYSLYNDEVYENLCDIILNAAIEIKKELTEIFDDIIQEGSFNHRSENYVILTKALSNVFDCGRVYLALPLKLIELAKKYWMFQKNERYYSSSLNMEDYFGINQHNEYYPESAYQTPMYLLLRVAPKESIDCIIEIINHATTCYKKSHLEIDYKECHEIEIVFSDEERVKQVCSDRLWKLHRGTSVAPDLLESILMALEKWLLDVIKEMSEDVAVSYCFYLLKKSNNVAVTSVVVSVVIANPDKLFEVACVLLKTKDIFHYDISRCVSESSSNFLKGMPGERQKFDIERIESNNKEFRKSRFENVIIDYQLFKENLSQEDFRKRREKLYLTIDKTIQDIDNWNPTDKFAYYRMDLRKYKEQGVVTTQDGSQCIELKTDMPEELVELSNNHQKASEYLYKHIDLNIWAFGRYTGDKKQYKKYSQFEDSPVVAFDEAVQILNAEGDELGLTDVSAAIYTCAVLLRDFKEILDEEQVAFCNEVVLEVGYDIIEKNTIRQAGDGTDAIIPELARMASCANLKAEWNNPLFILLAIVMNYGQERENASKCIAKILWRNDRDAAVKLVYTYIKIIPKYVELAGGYNGIKPVEFFEKYKAEIGSAFSTEIDSLDSIDTSDLGFNNLLILNTMLDSEEQSIHELVLNTGKDIWGKLFGKNYDEENSQRDYKLEYYYMEWLADYVLNQSKDKQGYLLQQMVPLVRFDREFGHWLHEIISIEDKNPRYDAFWNLWNLLQSYIFAGCDKNMEYYKNPNNEISIGYGFNEMLVNYLLACSSWREDVNVWHTLKSCNSIFYKVMANRIGYNAATLYSISRVLNSVGKDTFKNEGIDWLSTIAKNNLHLHESSLPVNTLYYVEEYIYSYIRREQCNFRINVDKKRKVLSVLDFLVNRGSTVGFLLREEMV